MQPAAADAEVEPQHQAQDHRDAEHAVAETVEAASHQLQARLHVGLARRLGQVDQDARQVEHRRHPGDDEDEVEGLDPQVKAGLVHAGRLHRLEG